MENKICIYAICKNEAKFVEKWLNSMSEADYIVVLDTGSEDETFELLKNDKRVYRVEQKVITPWRFDVARNESMKLIPDDANILMCTDLDEVLEPGWAAAIKENWIDGFHVRGHYKYAWSHTDLGEPARIFYYDKLHDRNYKWRAPVHELLYSDVYDENYEYEHTLNLFDKVYLHHYPDQTKSRSSYLPLLELRAKEDPNDYYGKYYLAHEYYYRGFYGNSIDTFIEILTDEKYSSRLTALEIAACYLFLGDCYRAMNKLDEAIYHYSLAIEAESSYREPYLYIAEILNEKKLYEAAIGYVQIALRNTYRHYNWLERDDSWSYKIEDILAVSYFYINQKELALQYALAAFSKNPTDERLAYNVEIISSNQ